MYFNAALSLNKATLFQQIIQASSFFIIVLYNKVVEIRKALCTNPDPAVTSKLDRSSFMLFVLV